MSRRHLQSGRYLFLLIVFLVLSRHATAQYDVYANQFISSTTDVINPAYSVDASRSNYASINTTIGVLATSAIRVRFPEWGNAGDVVNIEVQGTGGLLDVGLLDNITVKLYDSAGTTPVASVSGSSLLQLSLLTPGTNIYALKFITNPTGTYRFKEARIELSSVLSVSLTEFRIYGFFFQRPCPPVYADKVTASGSLGGLLSLGWVDEADRMTDANPDNYATMHTLIGLLGLLGDAYIDVTFPKNGKAGDYVGFTVAPTTGLLDLSILGGLTINTYDAAGSLIESKNGSTLLNLKLLAGTGNRYSAGFITKAGSYRIAKVRIIKTAVVDALSALRVYNAFYYTISRPPVKVTTSGPTTFCSGSSVTLTASDSFGATNFVWSNGATTSSITVNTAGTYYVEVTDSFSCTRRSIPIGVVVNANPVPVIGGDSVLCLGNSGALNLGSTTYASSLWNTGATTASISGVSPGRYYVRVTDANTCSGSDTITVIQNKLNILGTVTPVTCNNGTNGAISLSVSGGSGNYSYKWSDGSTTATLSGKKEGVYTCIVKDNVYGCFYNRSFSITAANTLSAKVAVINTSSCAGTDGNAVLTVIGGSGSYTYAWSNGATAAAVNNVSAGIYNVTVTDAVSGCQYKDTVAISDGGNNLVLTPTVTNATSCSSPNGAVSLAITGGSGTYTYIWSTGATSSSVSGLKAGNYYVIAKDAANSCSKALLITVANNGLLTANASLVSPGCRKSNGSISVTSVTGGSGPYSYAWSNGATTSSVSGLQAGTYLLTLTDAGSGCSKQEIFVLSDSSGPAAGLTLTQPDCGANSNGAITVTAGGTNNMYAWSNGAVTKNISNLKPGTYTLTVTDTLTGCTSVYLSVLSAKSQMRIVAAPSSNTSCATAADGAVQVTITGGTAPYSYSWSGGETTKDITGKNEGTYGLNVTDANSCVAAISVPIKTDTARLLHVSLASVTKATCNTATNGAAIVTVTGGKAPYTYTWTPGGATTKDLVNVAAGTYTLNVKDAVGCTRQLIAAITIDSSVAMKGTIDSTRASGCAASASGAVFVSITGGAAPYNYQWKKGLLTVASTKNLTAVTAGSYMLTVTDNNGCTLVLNATVPVLSTGSGVTAVLDSVHRPTCTVSADGGIFATVSGGLPPYTYLWSNGAATEDINNVNPGTYTLTATDANGCPGQLITVLNYDTSKTLVVKADSVTGAGCITGKSGAFYITASGGTTPYNYAWSDGAATADLINVVPGSYSVKVTDSKGCFVNLTAAIGVDTSKSIRAIVDSVVGAGCVGSKSGKIFLTVTRGVAPYSYAWSTGAVTEDIPDAAPGVYSVNIGDAAGCFLNLAASVGVDTAKKIIITADSIHGATCALGANGSVFVTVKGGKAPYVYSWSNGAATASLLNVVPGFYTLNVLDAAGCSAAFAVTVTIDAGRMLKVNGVSIKDAGCSGSASGAVTVAVSGGVPPYTYAWSNGATTKDLSNVVPGSYTLTVKDAAGCSEEYSANVKVDASNSIVIATTSVTDAKCAGSSSGSIIVNVSGGVPPYTYAWSNGATTKDLTFIPSGSYLLTVTDAIKCTSQLSVNVGINNANPVMVTLDSVRKVGCADTLSGAAYISVTGGTSPYSYMWSNGAATQDLINVAKGAYQVNVTDDAGCSDNLDVTIGTSSAITIAADVTMVRCNGEANGAITVTGSGGSGTYTYKWTDGNTMAARTGLDAGAYTVTVTDVVSGCNAGNTYQVTEADSIRITATVVKDSCLPGADGRIALAVTGGVTPYAYSWSNGATSDLLLNLAAQQYSVTVTDANGCTASGAYTVTEADCNFNLEIHNVITPNGDGVNDYWVIEGIQFYANSMLRLVDKWGDLVYEKRHYDNSFNGVNSKNGNALPSGTYYYILKLNEPNKTGGDDTYSGALLIQR